PSFSISFSPLSRPPPPLTLFPYTTLFRSFLRFGQAFLWVSGAVVAVIALGIVAGLFFLDGFGQLLLDFFTMGWAPWMGVIAMIGDRKSTRLNSSHVSISYAAFCFQQKNNT